MLTRQDAKNLADKVLGYAKLPGCTVNVYASENVFIRFANNGITTSGYSLDQTVSIESTTEDKRSGSANVSEWSDDALKNGVELADRVLQLDSHLPVLFMSGDVPRVKLRSACLAKPFKPADLVGRVAQVLEASDSG